jgi:hypothetical protein
VFVAVALQSARAQCPFIITFPIIGDSVPAHHLVYIHSLITPTCMADLRTIEHRFV